MTIRLGIFGSKERVKLILSVAQKNAEFECVPFSWEDDDEMNPIESFKDSIDVWLFSGMASYTRALKWGELKQPAYYVEYSGSSIYKTLLYASYSQYIKIHEMSFDSFDQSDIENVLNEVGIGEIPVHVKPFDVSTPIADYVNFHYELWKTGKVKGVVTAIFRVKEKLENLGVPAFCIYPTKVAIKSKLNEILRDQELLHFKDAQIAVQMLEVDIFNNLSKDLFSTDELFKIELKITEKLLRYAKKVHGSLKTAGPGRFVIFTTRGVLKDITNSFTTFPDIEEIGQIDTKSVTCGIGIGQSAYEAEMHAGKALITAKEYGKGTWMALLDNKTFIGPLGSPNQLSFSYSSKELLQVSQNTSLSISTLNKIVFTLDKIGKKEISAHELGQHLQIMPRSARRIIKILEDNGYAQVVEEENPHPRGRPRNIYRIKLTE